VTKGDNNGAADGEIRAVQIRGVVWYAVPWIGYINNLVNGDARAVVIPLVATALFLSAGWMIVSSSIQRRRRRRRQEAEDRDREIVRGIAP
jgi:signal peptidase